MEDIYKYLVHTVNLISKSRFRNKMILKGGSVLISKMIETNRIDLYRRTTDIDIHCDKKEVWVDFYSSVENILNNNPFGYIYRLTDRRSGRKEFINSDTLIFELNDTKNHKVVKFKIDMNIKSNSIITCEYSPILDMMTYDIQTSLSDKIVVISSQKIYRRIKDLYDTCVLVSLSDISYQDMVKHIQVKHPDAMLTNMLVQSNFEKLSHAYDLFDGIANKPDIWTLIGIARAFTQPFYFSKNSNELIWRKETSSWTRF